MLTLRRTTAGQRNNRRYLGYLAAALFALAMAYYVWPTPYSYMDANLSGPVPLKVRTNRFTGKMEVLLAGYGWSSDFFDASP